MEKIEIAELLKGLRPIKDSDGNIIIQSINNMKLVCLTTDEEFSFDKFANPLSVDASNRSYGHLNLQNKEDKPMIVPAQIAVMTKKAAQNHAMVKGAYIPKKSNRDFHDAGCIEGSQTGYIDSGKNIIRMLPFGAREYVLPNVNRTEGYQNVYNSISRVGMETGANSDKYLDRYFSTFNKKIAEFIAHFELLDETIGVIVFVNDEIVGIDKFPSFTYAKQIWETLIRDCYGSIAITEERKNSNSKKEFTNIMSKSRRKKNEDVSDFLERVLNNTKTNLTDNVTSKIEDLISVEMNLKLDNETGGYKSYIVEHEGYIGQTIEESGHNHLVSIVKKGFFDPAKIRKAREMQNVAKKQQKFVL
jgi:hypothetical protein